MVAKQVAAAAAAKQRLEALAAAEAAADAEKRLVLPIGCCHELIADADGQVRMSCGSPDAERCLIAGTCHPIATDALPECRHQMADSSLACSGSRGRRARCVWCARSPRRAEIGGGYPRVCPTWRGHDGRRGLTSSARRSRFAITGAYTAPQSSSGGKCCGRM